MAAKRLKMEFLLLGTFLFISGNPPLRAETKPDLEASCHKFVQDFYDWYVGIDTQNERTNQARTAMDIALRLRPEILDRKLLRMLRADSQAQAKANELVGLDFDPFFNSQDPSPQFKVSTATYSNGSCTAAVHGIRDGIKQERVYPNLRRAGDSWQFVDFHYEKGQDLISILEALASGRKKPIH